MIPSKTRGLAFTFTLPSELMTSAGVYRTSDDVLVRTLWSATLLPEGQQTHVWDHLDDAGVLMPADEYTVKLIHHSVKHEYEGSIGNTSWSMDPNESHTLFRPLTCMQSIGNDVFYAAGGNEAQNVFHGFDVTNPQKDKVPAPFVDPFAEPSLFAIDSARLYFVSADGFGATHGSLVFAIDRGTGARTGFSGGTPVCLLYRPGGVNCYPGQNYLSGVLHYEIASGSEVSGIAVQQSGNILALAVARDGLVRRYNKTTGLALPSLSVSLIRWASNNKRFNQIAFTPAGDLWVVTSNTAMALYTAMDSPSAPTLVRTITIGTNQIVGIATDPGDSNSVWVMDGGTNQQVKKFSATGNLLRTIGTLGGYGASSAVTGGQFGFFDGRKVGGAIVGGPDGSVWVSDWSTCRILKFVPGNAVATDRIAYRPKSYCAAVDQNNPERVFSNFLEYSVDYSKNISDPAAWTLVRNWLPAFPSGIRNLVENGQDFNGFWCVVTLSNNRTYAIAEHTAGPRYLVELLSDGTVRDTGIRSTWLADPRPGTNWFLYKDGSRRWVDINPTGTQLIRQTVLSGFDGSNNPTWAAATTLATLAHVAGSGNGKPIWNGGTNSNMALRLPVSANGDLVLYDTSYTNDGYHLGAVTIGGTDFNWMTAPSGYLDFKGTFQTRTYDSQIDYSGSNVDCVDEHIFAGFHGEKYLDRVSKATGQACQFFHHHENGLFVSQFGVPTNITLPKTAGAIGNAFCFHAIKLTPAIIAKNGVGGDFEDVIYIYTNDESTFGGVARWKISNLDSIVELSGSADTGQSITLA